ncbi:adenine-specific methyltransferase EcoRI family protein [Polaromonas sp. CG_23.6]|uniref:adenine-specific methyltransferase EcoRI family protein n=1 Tax=Polaromonas sp. CG_23.6 TaxID=2760709 RepID=UPI002475001A|nr:adenine-specific methyltransferase EcoRI family protein [Polaromonas sp. CG_23.6]MDH6182637.1 hypothetical protein [Polaromonas sp. CG_23.6]
MHVAQRRGDILVEKYSPARYQHYDSYDAIEVSKVADIPEDWTGRVGWASFACSRGTSSC